MVSLHHETTLAGLISLSVYRTVAFDSISVFSTGVQVRPSLIVFDPDRIIWPFKVDELNLPLFKKNKNVMIDRSYQHLKVYRQVPALFEELHSLGHQLALISQSAGNETICQLINFFGLDKFIKYMEIYPGNKTELVEAIYLKHEIEYGEMLYLVYEYKDVVEMADLGMVCILVGDGGVTMKDIRKGLHIFSTESPEYSYSEDTHESDILNE